MLPPVALVAGAAAVEGPDAELLLLAGATNPEAELLRLHLGAEGAGRRDTTKSQT